MEAVPRLPMLWIAMRKSTEGTSFSKLKRVNIAKPLKNNLDSQKKPKIFRIIIIRIKRKCILIQNQIQILIYTNINIHQKK